MRVLALDTTTRAGSVGARRRRVAIVDERDAAMPSRTHAERLPGELVGARRRARVVRRTRSISSRSRRARVVHRAADRHRDDSGAGVRHRAAASWRSRRSRRWRRAAGARAASGASSARGWMRIAATCSARSTASTDARAVRRRSGSSKSMRRRVGDPAATLARWRRRDAAARRAVRRRRRGAVRGYDRAAAHPAATLSPSRRCWPAPSAGWRSRARSAARRSIPAAVQPLYVRRPDAEIDARAEHKDARGIDVDRWTGSIEPLTSADGHRRRPRGRGRVVHESVDARDVPRRAREPRASSFCYLARDAERQRRRLLLVLARRRRAAHQQPGGRARVPARGRGDGAAERACCGEGARLGAVRATLEVRRSNDAARQLYERFGFSVAGVRRGYYTKPVEDALVLWRDGLAADLRLTCDGCLKRAWVRLCYGFEPRHAGPRMSKEAEHE